MQNGLVVQIKRTAVMGGRGIYRYVLRCVWDESKPVLFCLLCNPSDADDTHTDQTDTITTGRAMRLGYGSKVMLNAFAFRSPFPEALLRFRGDPVGPSNDLHIQYELRNGGDVLCGWTDNAMHLGRDRAMRALLARTPGLRLLHLGLTKAGQPRHPLYIPLSQNFTEWRV